MDARRLAVVALAALTVGCQQIALHRAGGERSAVLRTNDVHVPRVSEALFRPQIVRPTYTPVVATRHRAALPDGSDRLFPGHRVVAFYGAAGAPSLGVLGTGSPEEVWPRLARTARHYRSHKVR